MDRFDTLYVASGDTVKVFAPGYTGSESAVRVLAGPNSGVGRVTGMALDNRGWLYLAEREFMLIRAYAPGASGNDRPSRTIAGSRTRLSLPMGIALDRARRLYVTNGPPLRGGRGGYIQRLDKARR